MIGIFCPTEIGSFRPTLTQVFIVGPFYPAGIGPFYPANVGPFLPALTAA